MTKYNKLVISRILQFMSIVQLVAFISFFHSLRFPYIGTDKMKRTKTNQQKYQTETQRKTSKVAEPQSMIQYEREPYHTIVRTAKTIQQKDTPIDVDRSIAPHTIRSWICTQNANWFIHFALPLQNTYNLCVRAFFRSANLTRSCRAISTGYANNLRAHQYHSKWT